MLSRCSDVTYHCYALTQRLLQFTLIYLFFYCRFQLDIVLFTAVLMLHTLLKYPLLLLCNNIMGLLYTHCIFLKYFTAIHGYY